MSCLTGTVYPVNHQFGEPIVFPFLHLFFVFFRWRVFILEQYHYRGILSFCCFICILLLLIFCLSFSVSPFLCPLFWVSFSVCLLFCLSPFLCVSFSVCLLFSVSPVLCVSFSLFPFLCLLFSVSQSLSVCIVLCYYSLLNSLAPKTTPCWIFFALLELFRPVRILSPGIFPLEFFPLLIFIPCWNFPPALPYSISFVFPSSFSHVLVSFLINQSSIFPIITYYPKLSPSDNTLPDPPP